MFQLKKYRGAMFVCTKDYTKFEGNWLVLPKIDMMNLAKFHQSTRMSPNWDLDGILFSKVENV